MSDEQGLGIKTNDRSTNWYVFIGNDEKGMIVAGCQLHYCVLCENKPPENKCINWKMETEGLLEQGTPSRIYIAE